MKSYLLFQNIGFSESGKTLLFTVFSGTFRMGIIKWYAPWRKYCFFPANETLFDSSCLSEINQKLGELTGAHYKKS